MFKRLFKTGSRFLWIEHPSSFVCKHLQIYESCVVVIFVGQKSGKAISLIFSSVFLFLQRTVLPFKVEFSTIAFMVSASREYYHCKRRCRRIYYYYL